MGDNRKLAVVLGLVLGCDPEQVDCPEDVPEDFECPAEVGPFELGECGPYPDAVPTNVLEATVDGDVLHVHLETVVFRDNNEICGFVELQDHAVRLLLQPCLLRPQGVSKGDCFYTFIDVDVDEVDLDHATALEVYQRVDRSVELEPYTPELIASAPLP